MLLFALCSTVSIAQDRLEIQDFSFDLGETKTLAVDLINEVEYTAFQFDVMLPEGFGIVTTINEDDEEVLDITLDANRKKSTHVLTYDMLSPGKIRIAAYSSKNAGFKNNSGTLVNITVKASEDMAAGNYVIKLTNIKFADSEANGYPLSDVIKNIQVTDGFVVGAVEAAVVNKVVDVYTLDGTKVATGVEMGRLKNILRKGVYIVDGKKFLVK